MLTEQGTKRKRAPEPPWSGPCDHGVNERSRCKFCALEKQNQCAHGRQRSKCKECGGVINLRARSCALSVQ